MDGGTNRAMRVSKREGRNMIPKVIHYCWFGGNEKSPQMMTYIDSWKKYCPDYQIIEWNETNYDVTKHPFMAKAYQAKKWAFVSDYARVDILHEQGGIYLDTDVELISGLDAFLQYDFFAGFESESIVAFGLGFGAVAGHPILKDILEYYDHIEFPDDVSLLSKIACPIIQTEVLKKHGLVCNNREQDIEGGRVFDTEYFCPMSFQTGEMKCTAKTVSIHHYDMSWTSKENIEKKRLEWRMINRFGYERGKKTAALVSLPGKMVRFPGKVIAHLRKGDLKAYFTFLFRKRDS